MSQLELLKIVLEVLEKEQIEYMLVGSFVSSIYGEPRSTQDIDIVVELERKNVSGILSNFQAPRYYLDEDMIQIALSSQKMFNLLDTETGDKIDFYILKENSYEREKFNRKKQIKFMGNNIYILSIEDSIISKLKWCKDSGNSEKQFNDVKGIYKTQRDIIDKEYIYKKCKELDLIELFNKLLKLK